MKIIHLANHCLMGNGNAHVAVDLACLQARSGHAVVYASSGGSFVDLLTSFGVRHARIVQNSKKPAAAVKALTSILSLCSEFKPDILHAHMFPGAFFGYFASKIARVPLVNTVHNSFDLVKSHVMRFGDCVVAVSDAEKELLLSRGFRAEKIQVVVNGPNGSPRESICQQEAPPQLRKPAVVTVCGLHKRKGVNFLIRAFRQVAQQQQDWTLYIAGAGPDYRHLIALAEEVGVADRVQFLGFVINRRALLAQADIFVLASLAEPCGLAISEARAAGCAIIGTSVGGTPEQLEGGRAGALVEPGNVDQLAESLISLMSDPRKLDRAKMNALENSQHFGVERVVSDYDAVYRRLLAAATGA